MEFNEEESCMNTLLFLQNPFCLSLRKNALLHFFKKKDNNPASPTEHSQQVSYIVDQTTKNMFIPRYIPAGTYSYSGGRQGKDQRRESAGGTKASKTGAEEGTPACPHGGWSWTMLCLLQWMHSLLCWGTCTHGPW